MHITAAAFAGIKIEDRATPTSMTNAAPTKDISNADVVRDMPVRTQDVRWQARREAA